uniref:signal recognition particle 9 kDa protein-like n=1 Tax=Jaculus jaculus TaxID=51337 RepID=UPI001E1B2A3B|nr:signal recognition particle 9 kDa protein-like [Jaculus jaculus]
MGAKELAQQVKALAYKADIVVRLYHAIVTQPLAGATQYQVWEELGRAAEKLYLADPMKVRVVLKYRPVDGNLYQSNRYLACLVYKTDQAHDVKKIEKFHSQLMRFMVSKESLNVIMESE